MNDIKGNGIKNNNIAKLIITKRYKGMNDKWKQCKAIQQGHYINGGKAQHKMHRIKHNTQDKPKDTREITTRASIRVNMENTTKREERK